MIMTSSMGIASERDRRRIHFMVCITQTLVQGNEYIGLQCVNKEHNGPPLNLHLFEEYLLEFDLLSLCRLSKKMLPGHCIVLTRCWSMKINVGSDCTIRHREPLNSQKVLHDLNKTKQMERRSVEFPKVVISLLQGQNASAYPSILTVNSRPHLLHVYSTVTQLFRS